MCVCTVCRFGWTLLHNSGASRNQPNPSQLPPFWGVPGVGDALPLKIRGPWERTELKGTHIFGAILFCSRILVSIFVSESHA